MSEQQDERLDIDDIVVVPMTRLEGDELAILLQDQVIENSGNPNVAGVFLRRLADYVIAKSAQGWPDDA